ncbi:NAD(P)H-quinone dehydrogenase [Paenibacillus sp. JCM 10914]|uniref:FAD-dependent oxidoreductase n=1 Tax=Paenibacillus sp. JCM 10914 TaxID=1236974 RepID=UPI0003CC4E7A|nr:FAD-dependent oxidoreductase [Paenibacillus sp. JCM 10914]GAE08662.1 hypothetical protein JCM10914_4978 [Paenibacillus sp. JCM 10914]
MHTSILVLGGGPAGIEAALTAASYHDRVTLVTEGTVGDWKHTTTATWLSCLSEWPRDPPPGQSALLDMIKRAERVQRRWMRASAEQLAAANVTVITGRAFFTSPCSVHVQQHQAAGGIDIQADRIIIAVGSRPVFPERLRPDGSTVFSFHTLDQMNTLPETILVIGEGPIGFEAVHLFSRLGSKVRWLVQPEGPKCWFDPAIDRYLVELYRSNGVTIHPGVWSDMDRTKNSVIVSGGGAEYKAALAFVTAGFTSNVDQLNLGTAGLTFNCYGSLDGNAFGQTTAEHIYVAGDAQRSMAGVYATGCARVAALHAVGRTPDPLDMSCLPVTFHDSPQVGTVGIVDAAAAPGIHCIVREFSQRNFKAEVREDSSGFVKIVWNDEGVIIGGTVVGAQAKELITTLAIMVKMKSRLVDFDSFPAAHPSMNETLLHAIHYASDLYTNRGV